MKEPKRANIPLFIPHFGCPFHCVFCDQNAISGAESFSLRNVRRTIENALGTLNGRQAEIAFFGGSFTAIDRSLMEELLKIAAFYKETGAVAGIRLSTRPDCVEQDVLDILRAYGVTTIELGVQSMDDGVLRLSGRGHRAEQTRAACARINRMGCFSLIGQMMLGLPGSDEEKEMQTAQEICRMGAAGARIYPTAVLRGTALERMTAEGVYTPLDLNEALERGKNCLRIFLEHGVKVLRMGLCAEDSCEDAVVSGCYHPAYGEMVKSRLCLEILDGLISRRAPERGSRITVYTAEGGLSSAIGYRKENKIYLSERYGCAIDYSERADLGAFEFDIS